MMRKKITLLFLAVAGGICSAGAQTLTINNQTNCEIMIYGGAINVCSPLLLVTTTTSLTRLCGQAPLIIR